MKIDVLHAPQDRPPRTNKLAVLSLVCGILSVPCGGYLTGIPAIICGMTALATIQKSNGRMVGRGLAIAGLCTGFAGVVFGMVYGCLIFMLFWKD